MGKRGPKVREVCLEKIRVAVANNKSIAGVLRELQLRIAGGNYRTVKRAVSELRLDTTHWTGKGHRRGSRVPVVKPRLLAEMIQAGKWQHNRDLKRRLLDAGLLDLRCAWCRLTQWIGRPMSLELDHIDADPLNNLLDNLRLLCPNSHALTPTYRGRNIRKAADS